jgi:L-threonylcarbamoyladenylate synthase
MSASPLLRRAARIVRNGGVIAYPTEAVYGLGCDPSCREAVERILAIKARPAGAGFILIAASLEQLAGWISPRAGERSQLASQPAQPVTWIVTAGPRAKRWLTGGRRRIAVRVTTHPLAAALCLAAATPLVSTSANRHGRPPARTALATRRRLGQQLDLIVPGHTGGLRKPTEIRDAFSGAVIRRG